MDTTTLVVRDLLHAIAPRLRQLHVGELAYDGGRHGVSLVTSRGTQEIVHLLPADVPAIIESVVSIELLAGTLATGPYRAHGRLVLDVRGPIESSVPALFVHDFLGQDSTPLEELLEPCGLLAAEAEANKRGPSTAERQRSRHARPSFVLQRRLESRFISRS
jgi:hypothetical protein